MSSIINVGTANINTGSNVEGTDDSCLSLQDAGSLFHYGSPGDERRTGETGGSDHGSTDSPWHQPVTGQPVYPYNNPFSGPIGNGPPRGNTPIGTNPNPGPSQGL